MKAEEYWTAILLQMDLGQRVRSTEQRWTVNLFRTGQCVGIQKCASLRLLFRKAEQCIRNAEEYGTATPLQKG